MPSNNKCYYSGCNNTKKSRPDLVFHRFPTDKEKLLIWIQCSGHQDDNEADDSQWNHRLICSNHFSQEDYMPGCRPILNKNAVPKDFEELHTVVINNNINNDINDYNDDTDNVNNTINSRLNFDINCDSNECPNSSDEFQEHTNSNNDIDRESIIMKDLDNARLIIKKLRRRNCALRQRYARLIRKKPPKKWNHLHLLSLARTVIKNKKTLFIVEMQISHLKKKSWSDVEKNLALSLYQLNSKCYKFLRNECNMALPCVTLIRKWINELQTF
ncbi:PREDICTED: uncharacterized protein LOC107071407 [Polistes dominula]|uniref:Uncharacterized protein LOC107071407 n=1 Tax=Polistes dominula TaxID=743375 RepID=A0ABM1J089_POLDO|nr:PREDICTED: uncharacterized protein LOC107071407 [Polistes dominula]